MSAPLLFTETMKERFLEVLEETAMVKDAAMACGITPKTAHHHRRKDLAFSKAWDECLDRALDGLLGEAYQRATVGKSDRLLEVLLKFKYGDRMADRLNVKVEGSIGLHPDVLLQMPEDDRNALAVLLEKYQHAEQTLALEHDDGRNQ